MAIETIITMPLEKGDYVAFLQLGGPRTIGKNADEAVGRFVRENSELFNIRVMSGVVELPAHAVPGPISVMIEARGIILSPGKHSISRRFA